MPATVLTADVRVRSILAPGYRLVLLAIPFAMVPIADMPATATAAPGGAGQPGESVAESPAEGDTTWQALLYFEPVSPRWAGHRARRGGGAAASRAIPPRRPLSASMPAKAYEIDPGPAP